MLVLRRKVGESIILDGVISVSVLGVKIGITAPADVTIVREELLKNAQTPAPELPPSPTQSVQSESAPRL